MKNTARFALMLALVPAGTRADIGVVSPAEAKALIESTDAAKTTPPATS